MCSLAKLLYSHAEKGREEGRKKKFFSRLNIYFFYSVVQILFSCLQLSEGGKNCSLLLCFLLG